MKDQGFYVSSCCPGVNCNKLKEVFSDTQARTAKPVNPVTCLRLIMSANPDPENGLV